jgi:hypothetical protein
MAESARFELARVSPRRRLSGPQPYQISQLSKVRVRLSYDTMLPLRTRSAIRTHTVRALNAVPPAVGLPGPVVDSTVYCGQPRYRTEQALFAGQRCTPVRRPREPDRKLELFLRVTNPVRHLSRAASEATMLPGYISSQWAGGESRPPALISAGRGPRSALRTSNAPPVDLLRRGGVRAAAGSRTPMSGMASRRTSVVLQPH